MTILNARTTDDIADVIRSEWTEIDYLRCTENQMADEGFARFHGQTTMGGDRYFLARLDTDSIIEHTEGGIVKSSVEF